MAAAIGFAFHYAIFAPQPLIVFSLGVGFLDADFFSEVSTKKVRLSPGCLVAEAFDCGGEELTQCMINLARRCREETEHNLLAKPEMRHKVRLEAEMLKQILQGKGSVSFSFNRVFNGTVTAAEYSTAIKPIVDNIRDPDGFILNEIALVGGSTRLKCVRTVLNDIFPGTSFKELINSGEEAVYGAVVLADFSQKGQLQFIDLGFEICTKAPHVRPKSDAPSFYVLASI